MAQAPAVGCWPSGFLERRLRPVLRVRSELSLFGFSMYVSAGIPAPAQLAHLELDAVDSGPKPQKATSEQCAHFAASLLTPVSLSFPFVRPQVVSQA